MLDASSINVCINAKLIPRERAGIGQLREGEGDHSI
jgi:hypothetical protein